MHTRREFIRLSSGVLAGMFGAGASEGFAPAARSAETSSSGASGVLDPIRVTITATDFAFDAPAMVSAGLVTIELINEGGTVHMAQIGRLNDDVTFEQFTTVLEAQPQGSALPLFSFRGGPNNVPPGGSQTVVNRLDAGLYVLICFVADPDRVQHFAKGMLSTFEVTGEDANEPDPVADLTVSMIEFAYKLPEEIPAGRQVWEVVNDGAAPHDLEIMRLQSGVGQDEAIAAFMALTVGHNGDDTSATVEAGPPLFASAGGLGTLAPGQTGWLVTDLVPGDYLTLCQVPNRETRKLHYMEGMVRSFTVVEV